MLFVVVVVVRFDTDGSGELDFHEFLDLRESMLDPLSLIHI